MNHFSKKLVVTIFYACGVIPMVAQVQNVPSVTVRNEVKIMKRNRNDKMHGINVEVVYRFQGQNTLSKEGFIHGHVIAKNIPFGKTVEFNAKNAVRRGLSNLQSYFTGPITITVEKIKVHVHGHWRGAELERPMGRSFEIHAKQGYHVFDSFMILPADNRIEKPKTEPKKTISYEKKEVIKKTYNK